ncbi:hypothetical protein [Nocardia pneumoniae]|uniref:hypothetical protein n=1 Tax=Nocardia pneumoniae TaxID=228601 RepID=UPI001FDF9D04|nr:hypothetical protein [Nocardia pneumoniae]
MYAPPTTTGLIDPIGGRRGSFSIVAAPTKTDEESIRREISLCPMDLPRQHRPVTHLATLVVRPLGPSDEQCFLTLRTAIMDEGPTFAKDYQPGITWDEYLTVQDNARHGVDLPADAVPYTFLVAEIDGALVGSSDIRHHLTDGLMRWGRPHRLRHRATVPPSRLRH